MRKDWKEEKIDPFVHHWKYYLPPARASPSDLKFIEKKILEKGKNIKVLILGSTPEYRNLCGKLGVEVTCFDFSKYNFEYLMNEVKHKPKETFVEGDWVGKVLDEKFDIILGDNVVNMLMKKDFEKFLSNIAKMLKDDGLFIPRTYIRDQDERYTGLKAVKEFREERKGQHIHTAMTRNLFVAAYDFEKDMLVFTNAYKIMKDLHDKKLINDEELDYYNKLSLENREFKFFIPEKIYLDKTFLDLFKIKETFYGEEEYLRDQLPLHVLTKKRKKINYDIANKWKNQSPPIRPSKYDLDVFEKVLDEKIKEKGKDIKVLILGSTPEFRDLINEKGLTAYVSDYSEDNYKALSLLKKTKGKEVFINQDWVNLKSELKFDLIFAEASLNMVNPQGVESILKNVVSLLKSDGLFISKTWQRISKEGLSIKNILDIYRTKYKNLTLYNSMNVYFMSYFYDTENNHISLRKRHSVMKKLYEDGIITKKEFSSYEGLGYENSNLNLYMPLKEEIESILKRYMKIIKIIIPKAFGVNKIPIYVLSKKDF